MGKTAILFAGQGTQYVGMGQDLCEQFPQAQEVYNKANDVLGFDLKKLSFNGPKEELDQTINTQPAVYTYNMAVYAALGSPKVDFVAGHSLGEVCAVTASGAVTLDDGFDIIKNRANFMAETAQKSNGSMIAVVGLEPAKIQEIISNFDDLYLSNFNNQLQTTVSGPLDQLEKAKDPLKKEARMVVDLAVSGAFHSPFMQEAAADFKAYLDDVQVSNAAMLIIANVDAQVKTGSEEIKNALAKQVEAPVQFVKMLEFLDDQGVDTFIEIGPAKVLANLIKRPYPQAKIFTTEKIDLIKNTLFELRASNFETIG